MSKIQLRRDTTTKWGLENPVLALGEIGVDVTERKFKIGNGNDTWTELEYGTLFVTDLGVRVAPLSDDGTIPDQYINFPDFPDIHNFEYYPTTDDFPDTGEYFRLYVTDELRLYGWSDEGYKAIAHTPFASAEVAGTIRLTGDLGGDPGSPVVAKVKGVEIVGGPPVAGRVLKATSATQASWQTDSVGGGGGGGGEDARIGVYEETIGNGTANPVTITHGLNSRMLHVSMTRVGGDCEIVNIMDIKAPSAHAIVFTPDRVIEESGWRLSIMATLGLSDITPPTEPTLAVTDETSVSITATASGSTDDVAIAEYRWFAKLTSAPGLPQYKGSTTVPTYTFAGLNGASQYSLAVTAVDTSGNESEMSDIVLHTTDIPLNVLFGAHGGAGARRNNAAGSLSTPAMTQAVPEGFAGILVACVAVTHANSIQWQFYNSLGVTDSVGGDLIKVPNSSKNVYSDGASEAYGSVHWFYKLNPTPGDHSLIANWSDNNWADGLRLQSAVYFNVDQTNPFNGEPVLYGGVSGSALLNITKPSAVGNKTLVAIGSGGIMSGFNKTQRGDVVGSSNQGFCDYLTMLEADGEASVNFTSTVGAVHCASAIDLRKVS